MTQCELCGKSIERTQVARIEGVEMNVCSACAPLGIKPKEFHFKPKRPSQPRFLQSDEVVVENVHKLIKQAREDRNMKQAELAKAMSLKESQLHQFESGSRKPTVETAKKMQKFLHVKLVVAEEQDDDEFDMPTQSADSNKGFTLGDMIKKK